MKSYKSIFTYYTYTMLILLSIISCHRFEEEGPSYNRTVLIYMAAENSLSSFLQEDIDEITQAIGDIPQNSHLLVYLDDYNLPRILSVEQQQGRRPVCKTLHQYTSEHNSGDTETLRLALDWTSENFPSDSYGLVLWSHGSSWMPAKSPAQRAICQDTQDHSNSWMNIKDIAEALEGFPQMEFILFDACWMQSVEVAYELRNTAHYLLGSPAEIPGPGAPYQYITKALFSTPFDANEVIYQYYNYYSTYPKGYGAALSAVDCSVLGELLEVTSEMISKYITIEHGEGDLYGVQKYVLKYNENYSRPDYYDMNSYMKRLLPEEDYMLWKAVFDRVVPYRYTTERFTSSQQDYGTTNLSVDVEEYGGMSCFVPQHVHPKLNKAFQSTSWYIDAKWKQVGW